MGSSVSKSETKVFTPKAPVDFSASFLSHLENSQESDYTRSQYTEKYIQERVASELKNLEAETVEKFQATTGSSLLKEGDDKLSVKSSNEKISNLTKILQESAKLVQVELSSDIKDARQSVIACLKDNQGKPLNCWDEVDHFKSLVHSM
ncbi:CIC11C00000003036 [Sungouiella intermedia]|uniref:CIC11C00000003036 n=1 Tax=Sungouiella intermedia TaxID=45354 RepID=A0A1L0CUH4_9ASCO|nr:CIC11C00000003036 [[Candida] intermedia]SGZ50334.1 CIC11C00000004791 [[Candida] intermedia]